MAVVDLRYARALDEVVADQKLSREGVKTELHDFAATLGASAPLREVLDNPSIPEEQKLRLLDSLSGRIGMSRTVRNFLATIVHHGRLSDLSEIVEAYLELADKDSGMAEAEVTSARPLDDAGRHAIEQSILRMTGGSAVRAVYREDPSLLGGAVVRVGSTVYDGSVRGQLEQMRQRMVAATN